MKSLPIGIFSLAISLELILIFTLPKPVGAQSTSESQTRNLLTQQPISVTFDPQDAGKPRTSAGGASRSPDGKVCPQDATAARASIAALIPVNHEALTVAKHPTFLVYMPQTSARQVFFSLQDRNQNNVYETMLPTTGEAGVMSIKLPADAPELEIGKRYKWYVTVMCGNALRPDSPIVEGEIRRVEPGTETNSELDKASPIERAALYGKNGIWQDTLATLADLRRSQPTDPTLTATWEQLLESVGLEAIAKEPLLN